MKEQEIIEGNKLIAEFMDWSKAEQLEGYCAFNEAVYQYTYDELIFHFSWDWLVPAIKKCQEAFKNVDTFSKNFGVWKDLYIRIQIALNDFDIEKVFSAVVEFVKYYNELSK